MGTRGPRCLICRLTAVVEAPEPPFRVVPGVQQLQSQLLVSLPQLSPPTLPPVRQSGHYWTPDASLLCSWTRYARGGQAHMEGFWLWLQPTPCSPKLHFCAHGQICSKQPCNLGSPVQSHKPMGMKPSSPVFRPLLCPLHLRGFCPHFPRLTCVGLCLPLDASSLDSMAVFIHLCIPRTQLMPCI